MDKENKNKKHKKIKVMVTLLVITLLTLILTFISLMFYLLKDSNRSHYKNRDIEYSEIIKKNYIDGFVNSKNTKEFSYILPKDDINELLSIGVSSLNDKHIENIYYDVDESNVNYFYVDLSNTLIKTRVKITTIPSIKDSYTSSLSIYSVTIGKVNAFNYLKNKGYLTSSYLNEYFKNCHLPITYDEINHAFEITPLSFINEFPNSLIGNKLFSKAKTIKNSFTLNGVFGFNLDLSSLNDSNTEYKDINDSSIPNIHDELLEACEVNYPLMSEGETKTVYSVNEETMNKLVKSSFESTYKEETVSSLTKNKLVYNIKGVNTYLNNIDKIAFKIFIDINGYLIDKDISIRYVSSSPYSFKGDLISIDSDSLFINEGFEDILQSLSNEYDFISYKSSNKLLSINFENMNNEFSDPDIKYSSKLIEINPATKAIDFKLTKD